MVPGTRTDPTSQKAFDRGPSNNMANQFAGLVCSCNLHISADWAQQPPLMALSHARSRQKDLGDGPSVTLNIQLEDSPPTRPAKAPNQVRLGPGHIATWVWFYFLFYGLAPHPLEFTKLTC